MAINGYMDVMESSQLKAEDIIGGETIWISYIAEMMIQNIWCYSYLKTVSPHFNDGDYLG